MRFAKFLVSYLMAIAFYNVALNMIVFPMIAFLCALMGLGAMTLILQFAAGVAVIYYASDFLHAVFNAATEMIFSAFGASAATA